MNVEYRVMSVSGNYVMKEGSGGVSEFIINIQKIKKKSFNLDYIFKN